MTLANHRAGLHIERRKEFSQMLDGYVEANYAQREAGALSQ